MAISRSCSRSHATTIRILVRARRARSGRRRRPSISQRVRGFGTLMGTEEAFWDTPGANRSLLRWEVAREPRQPVLAAVEALDLELLTRLNANLDAGSRPARRSALLWRRRQFSCQVRWHLTWHWSTPSAPARGCGMDLRLEQAAVSAGGADLARAGPASDPGPLRRPAGEGSWVSLRAMRFRGAQIRTLSA